MGAPITVRAVTTEQTREARAILGGTGAALQCFLPHRDDDLESVRTHEGTDEVHTLVLGQALTGIPAFR